MHKRRLSEEKMIVAEEKHCNELAWVWAGIGRQEVLGGRMQAPGSSDPGHYEGTCSLKQHVQARSPPKSDWTNLRSTSNKRSPLASARKRKLSEEGKQKLILNIPQAINAVCMHPHASASSARRGNKN